MCVFYISISPRRQNSSHSWVDVAVIHLFPFHLFSQRLRLAAFNTVVAGVRIGQVAIIYKRIMTNVKYLKHEFKSTQYIIVKKMSYLVEYKCDVCCFIMNDVQWIRYFGLGSSLCNL